MMRTPPMGSTVLIALTLAAVTSCTAPSGPEQPDEETAGTGALVAPAIYADEEPRTDATPEHGC
jgi:hypothetical protein